MATLKTTPSHHPARKKHIEKLKKILGLASVGVLFTAIALGIPTKESNPKISSNQPLNQNRLEDSNVFNLSTEIEQPKLVCNDLLEEDENTRLFREYNKAEVVECMFVGCGGFF